MSKRDKYTPDYHKLYPGVTITPTVMRVLTSSDRKMKYCEYDLKTERVRKNAKNNTVTVYPAREDSLDRLADEHDRQYALEEASPEESIADRDELNRLRLALRQLSPEEWTLINALYYQGLSEKDAGKCVGISQQGISKRLKRIYRKLKNFMEI